MRFYQALFEFVENYRSLFLNPRQNAAEIIIITALVVVGAIILWMFTGMLVGWTTRLSRRIRQNPVYLLTLGAYVGTFLFFVALIFLVSLPVTTSSAFCGRACHSMNPAYKSWRESAHAGVQCYACHLDYSANDYVFGKLTVGAVSIRKEFSGRYRTPINADSKYSRVRVPDSRCLQCHSSKDKFFQSEGGGIAVNHKKHLKSGLRCTACHNRVAHPGAERFSVLSEKKKGFKYKDFSTMKQGCWRCHKRGGRYVARDGTVHVGPYRTAAGIPVPTDCKACHSKFEAEDAQRIIKRIRARHFQKPPWRRGIVHGEIARQYNFQPCLTCHRAKERCTVCHKMDDSPQRSLGNYSTNPMTMPHPPDWIKPNNHGTTAKAQNFKPCSMCHTVGTVPRCAANGHHHEVFAAEYKFDLTKSDWKVGKETHGVVAKATGGAPCFRCHDQKTWCTIQCHGGITMPHNIAGTPAFNPALPQWRTVHFKFVEFGGGRDPNGRWLQASAPCRMCHNKDGDKLNYCSGCHHQRFGPRASGPLSLMALVRDEYQANYELNQRGRLPCEDCHVHQGLVFCRNCHYPPS